MPTKSDTPAEVSQALKNVRGNARKRDARNSARRTEAVSLRLAGLTYEQIGERLGVTSSSATALVRNTLSQAENKSAQDMRDLENARLDRAQSAIWSKVLQGDLKAIDTYLKISNARRQMNGLNAPAKVDVNMSIRAEMDSALKELESLVLEGEIVDDTAHQVESTEQKILQQHIPEEVLSQTLGAVQDQLKEPERLER